MLGLSTYADAVGSTGTPTVAMNLFGNKAKEEAAEAERLDREQEELNQRWAQESQNEFARDPASTEARP